MLLFICVLLVVFFSLAPDWIKERFNIINMLNSSGSGRTEVWLQFLTIYASGSSFEVLFGFGRGSIYYFNELGMTKYCTHNIYLKALIEGGVIGVLFFVLLVISIFVYIKKTRNYTLIALIGGYMICGIFLDLDDYRIFPLLIITLLLFGDTEYYLSFKKNKTLIVRNDLENIGSNVSL